MTKYISPVFSPAKYTRILVKIGETSLVGSGREKWRMGDFLREDDSYSHSLAIGLPSVHLPTILRASCLSYENPRESSRLKARKVHTFTVHSVLLSAALLVSCRSLFKVHGLFGRWGHFPHKTTVNRNKTKKEKRLQGSVSEL